MVDLVKGRDRGARTVIALVIALTVGALVAAFMLPIGIDALVDDSDVSFTGVSDGDTNEVISGSLNVTLDNINGTTDISVTLTDVDSGNTLALTNVTTSTPQSGTLEGETLTVTADSIDTTTADFTVSHPPDYAWSDGTKSLWGILDVIIVLAIFLFFIAMALGVAGRV